MMRDTFEGKRYYVARFGGLSVAFKSYWAPGTFGLGADAISACNLSGAPASYSDWDDLAIEGPFSTRWAAVNATKSPPDAASNAKVADKADDTETVFVEPNDEIETAWENDAEGDWSNRDAWADDVESDDGEAVTPENDDEQQDEADDSAAQASNEGPGDSNRNEEFAAHIAQASEKLRERLMRKQS